ncbi:MAG TPA: hypothetical protein VGJ81_05480 [Thermoanaerobaculia bacterium]|jgi:hypothetical protein
MSELLWKSRLVIDYLAERVEADDALMSLYVNAAHDEAFIEFVALLYSMGFTLSVADALWSIGAGTAHRFVGAALDIGLLGRGLIRDSVDLAILLGLVDSEQHILEIDSLLDSRKLLRRPIAVAYLDYLGVSEGEAASGIAETFAAIGRTLAARTGRTCYYWTASDTYCLCVTLDSEQSPRDKQVTQFILELLEIQERAWIAGKSWMWQIGASVGMASVVGDMVLPSPATTRAASLMKRAYLPNHGGGLILCDGDVGTTGVIELLRAELALMRRKPRMSVRGRTGDLDTVNLHELEFAHGVEETSPPTDNVNLMQPVSTHEASQAPKHATLRFASRTVTDDV